MIPKKLKLGDEIRVIAPSRSMSIISSEIKKNALKRLEGMGFKVTFGKHVNESDEFNSSSINSRLEDLHDAFSDKNVKAILTVIGGYNSNQLLPYLNYDLIKSNPKIFCGYSDITALQNAIYKKTGLVTYSGPHFSTFGMLKGFEYIEDYFKKCLMNDEPYEILSSDKWSDDSWYNNQDKRKFISNKGYLTLNQGNYRGDIVGANLETFNLLHGTEYVPDLNNVIFFFESAIENEHTFVQNFDRLLQSNLHQSNFSGVKGLVIGRFQKNSGMTNEKLIKIIKSKKEIKDIPIIANVDYGHTSPLVTFPIGGKCEIEVSDSKAKIVIIEH